MSRARTVAVSSLLVFVKAASVCHGEAIEVRCIDFVSPRACIPACIVSSPVTQSPLHEIIMRGAAAKARLEHTHGMISEEKAEMLKVRALRSIDLSCVTFAVSRRWVFCARRAWPWCNKFDTLLKRFDLR